MLSELKVKDFAIISELRLSFYDGFNILSGETGAGKSVLLKSLSLLMGGKASADIVRTKAKSASIEGLFDISQRSDVQKQLETMGIEHDAENLVVKRVITTNGKSKIYVNGSLSTLTSLTKVVHPLIQLTGHTAPLIEITGQHESKNLLERAYHLDLLDLYGDLLDKRKHFENRYHSYLEKKEQLKDLQENASTQEQKLDYLVFQRNEIESLNLEEGEETQLENKYKSIKNRQKLVDFQLSCLQLLENDDDAALTRLQKALQMLEGAERYDESLSGMKSNLESSIDHLNEYLLSLNSYGRDLDEDDESLYEVEERLSRFRKLQKKYGDTSSEILAHLEQIRTEINQIDNVDEHLQALSKEVKELELELKNLATKLHKARKKAAKTFADKVNAELQDLNMKGLVFQIDVSLKEELDRKGSSLIEFLCKQNAKDTPRPLSKTASGGELSRILLSIKKVIGTSEMPRTYLFDEVDTGVSGETAAKVGKKLAEISKGQQVICVTHLPQVASEAEHHFLIEKTNKKDSTHMQVLELDKEARINEVARLISGEKLSKSSLQHATELLGF